MKTLRTLSLLAAVLLAACAGNEVRGSGNVATEARTVPEFASLDVSGGWHVEITVGTPQSVEISGDDNLLPLVRTEMKDGALVVDSKENLAPKDELTLRIRVANIHRIESSGSSKITVHGVKNERLFVDLSGSAKFEADGTTKRLDVVVSGSADVDTQALEAEKAFVKISGSGAAKVNATKAIDASISGSGAVRYLGSPAEVKRNVSGSGSIEPL